MKKNFIKNLLAVAAVMATASCAKEAIQDANENPATDPVQGKCFTAVFEEVKSTLDQNRYPVWVEGDAIGVTTADDNNLECPKIEGRNAFNAEGLQGAATFYAVYPYAEGNTFADGVLTATVPTEQKLVDGQNVAPGALVAACKSDNYTLNFKNCVSLMQIEIPIENVKKVTVAATTAGQKLSGQFTMNLNAETLAPEVVAAQADSTVTLLPAGATFAKGTYYISVIPGTVKSIQIDFTNTADQTVSVKKTADTIFARSNGINMGSFFKYEINTAADLIKWAKETAKSTAWDVVNLNADIALTADQAANYVEAHEFKGTFNGNSHKISGLKTPLFGNLRGAVVKDLEVEANIVSNGKQASPFKGTDYGVGILAHYAYADQGQATPSISGVTTRGTLKVSGVSTNHSFNVGGVVGASNGVPISNCTNYATVTVENSTVTGATTNRIVVGGVVGVVQTNTKANLTNCTNAAGADVKVTSTCTSAGAIPVAGIAAYITQAVTVDGCKNNAAVTNEGAAGSTSLTAGIAAFIDAVVRVQNCQNNENATILCASTSATEQAQHTGGIVAYYNKEANITACKNFATVKLATAKNANCMTAGIAAYTYTKTTITKCENYGTIEDASTYATAKTHSVSGIANLSGSAPASGKSNINISECKNFGDVLNNATAVGSSLVGGIIANAPTYIVIDACENGSATVKPNIVSKNNCSYCYTGGIIGQVAKCATITNSKNYGTVKNSGVVSSNYRSGGIVGNSVQGDPTGGITQQSVYTSCENYGAIVNDSNTVKEVRLGGIIGGSSTKKVLVTLCNNFGDVYDTEKATSAPTDLCFGGISGYTGNEASQFEGCISKATITQRSASTLKRCGEIIGWFNSSSAWILKDNRIAGTVNGAAVTEANCKSAGFLFGTKAASDANTTGLSTNGYYNE